MRRLTGTLGALGLVLAASVAPAWAVVSPAPSPVASVLASPSVAPSASPTGSWLASPSPEADPFKPSGGMDVPILPYLLQLLVVTAVVGGLGYVSLKWAQKKMPGLAIGGAAMGKQIRVVERLTVDAKRMVFMVNVGDRYWLLAATDTTVTPIAELSKDDLGGQFAQMLEQEKHRGETL
ncbi:MAG: flagellar biosynthetic protein FliO [Candidatus Sericytochromatia bacterium]